MDDWSLGDSNPLWSKARGVLAPRGRIRRLLLKKGMDAKPASNRFPSSSDSSRDI